MGKIGGNRHKQRLPNQIILDCLKKVGTWDNVCYELRVTKTTVQGAVNGTRPEPENPTGILRPRQGKYKCKKCGVLTENRLLCDLCHRDN